jgi:hypothetical protein
MNQLLKGSLFLLLFISCGESQQPIAKTTATPVSLANDTTAPVLQNGTNPYAPVDVSPMDIAYFPEGYPIAKMTNPDLPRPKARVIYSRPHKQGRTIFGSLLKYGEHWRLGANEATELELFANATIQGKKVAAGRYVLYGIPQDSSWTIVFNNNLYSWGLKQDAARDVYRFPVPVKQTPVPVEIFTMTFQKTATGADLLMAWDNVVAKLPISF